MDPRPIESLTRREAEVLRLLDARLTTSEIAEVLDIPPEIVKRHTLRIYRKLAIRTSTRLRSPLHRCLWTVFNVTGGAVTGGIEARDVPPLD